MFTSLFRIANFTTAVVSQYFSSIAPSLLYFHNITRMWRQETFRSNWRNCCRKEEHKKVDPETEKTILAAQDKKYHKATNICYGPRWSDVPARLATS